MKGDFTRSTWDRRKHYTSVRMQQGRVQTDADWNEQAEIQTDLRETALRDVLGPGAVPREGGGFAVEIAPPPSGEADDLLISDGRLWIDGILCELGPGVEAAIDGFPEGDRDRVLRVAEGELEPADVLEGDWIEIRPAGAGDDDRGEMARITEISPDARDLTLDRDVAAPEGSPRLRRWTSLASQRDLPAPLEDDGATPAAGTHLVYLDVWRWHVTALEDPEIREKALGGPDTATRVRTVCQVRLLPLGLGETDDDGNVVEPGAFDCAGDLPGWAELTAPPTGRLRARTRPETDPEDPCQVPSGGGYVGLENQLYRIEVHDGGELGTATFKWSRDNGTVVTDWLGIDGDVLRVRSVGRDRTLSFHGARWVELTDDGRELRGEPGVIVPLLKVVDDEHLEVDLTGASVSPDDFSLHPKVRRWDMPDTADGALPIETVADNEGYLQLESGIEIRFEPGTYRTGDYWWIPARAFVGERRGDIEWPSDAGGVPLDRPPHGIEHHYMRLALVEHDGEGFVGGVRDCRPSFPDLADLDAGDVLYTPDPQECPDLVEAEVETVAEALDELCRRGPEEEPGIRVERVVTGDGQRLGNDQPLPVFRLLEGLRITCSEPPAPKSFGKPESDFPDAVPAKPTCFVSLFLPYPLPLRSHEFWEGAGIVGFEPIVLASDVAVDGQDVVWTPVDPTRQWLQEMLFQHFVRREITDRVLGTLTLVGNFIWSEASPELFLDADVFGSVPGGTGGLRLPSGDGRRGGKLEMWFWLVPDTSRPTGPGIRITGRFGSVVGRVVDADGNGLPGVRVLLFGENLQRTSTTDATGGFRFSDVPPGAYRLQAEFGGQRLETGVTVLGRGMAPAPDDGPVFDPADFPDRRLDEIPGIGRVRRERLEEAGITHPAEVTALEPARVAEVVGVSEDMAGEIIRRARELLSR